MFEKQNIKQIISDLEVSFNRNDFLVSRQISFRACYLSDTLMQLTRSSGNTNGTFLSAMYALTESTKRCWIKRECQTHSVATDPMLRGTDFYFSKGTCISSWFPWVYQSDFYFQRVP